MSTYMTGDEFEERKRKALEQVQQVTAPQMGAAEQAEVVKANAITREVDEKETSQYQLDKMLRTDSPLMERARTEGLQQGAARGLLNSSMAVGAAQGAMIDRAQPFAINDAATYFNTAESNMRAQNQAELQNAQMSTETNIFNVGQVNQRTRDQAGFDLQAASQNAQASNSALNSFLDRENSIFMMESNQAFQAAENAADRTLQTNLQANQQSFLTSENALDRAQQTALQDDAQAFAATQQSALFTQQTALQNAEFAQQTAMQTADQTFQTAFQSAAFAQQTALQDDAQAAATLSQESQQTFQAGQAELDRELALNQTNAQTASAIVIGTMDAIGNISADPNLNATQKTQAIANAMNVAAGMPELHNIVSGNNPPASGGDDDADDGGADGGDADDGGTDNSTPANPNPDTNTSFNADGDNNWATNNIVNPNTGGGRGGRNYSTPFGNITLTPEQIEAIENAERDGFKP
tara:strand:- start:1246 stop:2649 length:1404 start_codon:yes stop_codon:yes gene_type:complete